jgi:hypothetical protein
MLAVPIVGRTSALYLGQQSNNGPKHTGLLSGLDAP